MNEELNTSETSITIFDMLNTFILGFAIVITVISMFISLDFATSLSVSRQSLDFATSVSPSEQSFLINALLFSLPVAVSIAVFVISVLVLFKIKHALVKVTSANFDTKIPIIVKDGSSITVPLSKSNPIQFTIKTQGNEYSITGVVERTDVKLSETETSYVVDRTTKTTRKLFNLSETTESKSYLLYLKPETFKSLGLVE